MGQAYLYFNGFIRSRVFPIIVVYRNRLAAGAAFVFGILFIISGYQTNFELYYLVREQIPKLIQTQKVEVWMFVKNHIGILLCTTDVICTNNQRDLLHPNQVEDNHPRSVST